MNHSFVDRALDGCCSPADTIPPAGWVVANVVWIRKCLFETSAAVVPKEEPGLFTDVVWALLQLVPDRLTQSLDLKEVGPSLPLTCPLYPTPPTVSL